jgi:multidrug efflux system membrane fusion protein
MIRNRTPLVVLALAAVLIAAGCSKAAAPPAFERPPAPVTVAVATAEDVPVYLDEMGRIVAPEVVAIQPQVSGRVTEVHFAEGTDVRAGDPLFTIDPRPFQARLDAAEASLAGELAARDLAKIEFARVANLVESKAISKSEYDIRKNAVDVAEARIRAAEAAVDTARIELEYTSIRSPLAGRTGRRLVDAGSVVTANGGSMVVVQRMDPVYAEFTVTENDLGRVQRSLAAGPLKAEARLPDDAGAPREGSLTFIDSSVQEGTGTVRLRATLTNEDRRFWPGRFVRVRLVLETVRGAVLIPTAAPMTSPNGSLVYVAKDDGTADLRPVVLGQRQGDLVVVRSGVQAGERVVVTGQIALMPGGKLAVAPTTTAAAPSAAKGGGQ